MELEFDARKSSSNQKKHGRCVAHTSAVFVELGLITEEKGRIVSQAVRSDCGKKK